MDIINEIDPAPLEKFPFESSKAQLKQSVRILYIGTSSDS